MTGGLDVALQTTEGPGTTEEKRLEKRQPVFKWRVEFTYAVRYKFRDLGENLREDVSIINKNMLHNVRIFISSKCRVPTSAEIFTAASSITTRLVTSATSMPEALCLSFYHTLHRHTQQDRPRQAQLWIDKRFLATSLSSEGTFTTTTNASKNLMDDVKKRLKVLLRNGENEQRPELTWPKNMNAEPTQVVQEAIQPMSSSRTIMRKNFETLELDKIRERWCY